MGHGANPPTTASSATPDTGNSALRPGSQAHFDPRKPPESPIQGPCSIAHDPSPTCLKSTVCIGPVTTFSSPTPHPRHAPGFFSKISQNFIAVCPPALFSDLETYESAKRLCPEVIPPTPQNRLLSTPNTSTKSPIPNQKPLIPILS